MKLEELSCTDLKCVWNSQKNTIQDEFGPAEITSFCCLLKVNNIKINVPDLFDRLCGLNPNAAVWSLYHILHKRGHGTSIKPCEKTRDVEIPIEIWAIIDHSFFDNNSIDLISNLI